MGAARGTPDRLGMKPAIARVVVLARAVGAHGPGRQGGARAIVRQRLHDRKPWTTIGAVDVRVAGAPIGAVEQLALARGAQRQIGRNAGRRMAG